MYGSYIWPGYTAPGYVPGFVTTTMLQVGSFGFALAAMYLLRKYPEAPSGRVARRESA